MIVMYIFLRLTYLCMVLLVFAVVCSVLCMLVVVCCAQLLILSKYDFKSKSEVLDSLGV